MTEKELEAMRDAHTCRQMRRRMRRTRAAWDRARVWA